MTDKPDDLKPRPNVIEPRKIVQGEAPTTRDEWAPISPENDAKLRKIAADIRQEFGFDPPAEEVRDPSLACTRIAGRVIAATAQVLLDRGATREDVIRALIVNGVIAGRMLGCPEFALEVLREELRAFES